MSTGVVLLNFGEPATPARDVVVDYLERIFFDNASLEGDTTVEEARARSRQLAERRAPALIEEYEEIGGSPLKDQAEAQADAIQRELRDRGHDVTTYTGFQFVEPFVGDAVAAAREDGVDRLVGLPIYPLCGPSTTVSSLEDVEDAVEDADWDVELSQITGWHRHPTYNQLRVDNLRSFVEAEGVSLQDAGTTLVFSAHGTPQHYLDEGSRYREYVEEYCDTVATMLGVDSYELGYQNHENRDIPWTKPDVEDLLPEIDAERIVVEPVSFMHEQSETLSELDEELAEEAAEEGLDFHRVPIPHDDDRFGSLLADLVEPFAAGFDPGYYQLRQCQCKNTPGTVCLNARRQ
ncbi:ferrochelatase [Haloarculaceae archaeon H-GB1-1]|nr:ferrochelatase [Haloarculaceae archaeon H-GB1-1]